MPCGSLLTSGRLGANGVDVSGCLQQRLLAGQCQGETCVRKLAI